VAGAVAQGETTPDVCMCTTCTYSRSMSTMIQIRHVPDQLHRQVKARAAEAGMSLSDYLLQELRRAVERPTRAELLARLKRRSRVRPKERPADAVRAERDAR
jgi:hypothetical protein